MEQKAEKNHEEEEAWCGTPDFLTWTKNGEKLKEKIGYFIKWVILIVILSPAVLFFFGSCSASHQGITAEEAYQGVNRYCHEEYDWSIAEENPSIMSVEMGEESDSTYEVVFHSYTGSTVHFYVNKETGTTRMVEKVPLLDLENEAGTIQLFEYLGNKR
jgi:hypothetical protein